MDPRQLCVRFTRAMYTHTYAMVYYNKRTGIRVFGQDEVFQNGIAFYANGIRRPPKCRDYSTFQFTVQEKIVHLAIRGER